VADAMTDRSCPITPLVPNVDPAERRARLCNLPALAVIFGGTHHRLVLALAQAETGSTSAAASEAWQEMDTMPISQRRRILSSLATVMRIIDAPKLS
jgi:hypothetical protein